MAPERVWIDTDPSVSPGGHEVDDGFALLQALRSPQLQVCGLSATYGNAPLATTVEIASYLARRFGPPGLSVLAGAASALQLGQSTAATRGLVRALQQGELSVLALGPATTVATVIQSHPHLIPRIRRVVAVAGRRIGQRLAESSHGPPHRDFNFELDPEAFARLLKSPIPLVLMPWEACARVWIERQDLDRLARGPACCRWLARASYDWLELWQRRYQVNGFHPFDTLAVGYLTQPELFDWEDIPAQIHLQANDRSGPHEPAQKPCLLVSRHFRETRRVRYCHGVEDRFKTQLLDGLMGSSRAGRASHAIRTGTAARTVCSTG